MRSVGRKLVAACGVLAMACTMAACGGDTASDADDNSLMTVEVFDQLANYQGEQKGWFAKVIKDKFNIKLNIVAPNVAGGGSTLFDTRAAAGNLGDIVIIGSGSGQAEKVAKSKLVTDLSSYIKNTKYLKTYQGAIGQLTRDANQESGKGFMMLSIDDMKIASKGAQPNGTTTFIVVGGKAKNKERLVKFIDWLYSPEGIQATGSQTNGAAGLKGPTWDIKDGKPVLTDFGVKAMGGESVNVPEEYGGGGYSDGASRLNVSTVLNKDINPRTNAPYNYRMWDSELAKRDTALDKDWQEHMGGARTTMEYLEQSDKLAVIPGASYATPDEDSVISTTRGQLKTAVVNACWQAVFSKSDDEFNSIWNKMQKEVDGLGYKKVYDVDMKNIKDMFKARQAIEKEYASREK